MAKIVIGKKQKENTGGIFGNSKNANLSEDLNSVERRVKMLEEKYTNLRNRFQVTEQNMLSKNKNFFTDIKTINIELSEIKKEISELKDSILSLIKELKSFAKREDVDMLRKYIDLWNPVNFVTKNDVKNIVEETIDEMRRK
ncbi:hypothetical protein GF323_06180 [Candidatus Woesearchaeota archaeon]|nr:hypothetical protein [Candidatus Woesearchaeota archaeon]